MLIHDTQEIPGGRERHAYAYHGQKVTVNETSLGQLWSPASSS